MTPEIFFFKFLYCLTFFNSFSEMQLERKMSVAFQTLINSVKTLQLKYCSKLLIIIFLCSIILWAITKGTNKTIQISRKSCSFSFYNIYWCVIMEWCFIEIIFGGWVLFAIIFTLRKLKILRRNIFSIRT